MDWLETLYGGPLSTGVKLSVMFALLLIGLLVVLWLFKKVFSTGAARFSKNRLPRLSVTDAAAVDDKRRLVLVRRDNVEHLIMIGGPGDIVIERNIGQPQQALDSPREPASRREPALAEPATQTELPAKSPAGEGAAADISTGPERQTGAMPVDTGEPKVEAEPVSAKQRDEKPQSSLLAKLMNRKAATAPPATKPRNEEKRREPAGPAVAPAAPAPAPIPVSAPAIAASGVSAVESETASPAPPEKSPSDNGLSGDLASVLGLDETPEPVVSAPQSSEKADESPKSPAASDSENSARADEKPARSKTEAEMQRLLDEISVDK